MCDSAPVTLSALAALDSSVIAFGRQLAAVTQDDWTAQRRARAGTCTTS
jgi:hypothetical protein